MQSAQIVQSKASPFRIPRRPYRYGLSVTPPLSTERGLVGSGHLALLEQESTMKTESGEIDIQLCRQQTERRARSKRFSSFTK